MQCLQLTAKPKDREPRSPEQRRTNSSRSSSRRSSRLRSATGHKDPSPSPVARLLSSHAAGLPSPLSSPDAQLDEEIRRHSDDRVRLPILSIPDSNQPGGDQLIQQLVVAEAEMQRFHEENSRRHEGLVQTLRQKLEEMNQEDQGPTRRIEELERQRNMLQMAMTHVNQVHQSSKSEYERVLMRLEEASQAQHVRDREIAEALTAQLGQLRGEAASSYLQLEQKARGDGLNIREARERAE